MKHIHFSKTVYPAIIALLLALFGTLHAQECSRDNPNDCLDGVGPAVFNPDNIRVTSTQLSKHLEQSRSEENDETTSFINDYPLSGLAAGDMAHGWGIWGSYNYTDFEADIPINSLIQPIASYDANQHNFLAGIDQLFRDRLVLGAAVGYENSSIDTLYNGGNNDIDGWTVAPYAAYLINDTLNVDASVGYSSLDYDTDRIDNVSGGTIFGQFDSTRWFGAANLSASLYRNPWYLKGRVGYLYTAEKQDPYTETGPNTARTVGERHINLGQVLVSGEAAYSLGHLEPYLMLAYANDVKRDNGVSAGGLPGSVGSTQPDDKDEMQIYLGVRYFGGNFSGTLEYGRVEFRDTLDSQNVMLTLRYDL